MAGGRGERFWPKSRKKTPKQFLCLTDTNRTMLQNTVDRILPIVETEDIYISTNRDYLELVREQLPGIPAANILCEPEPKNTAPCIGWGAVVMRKRYGDAVMVVLPSDHQILQPALFRSVLRNAIKTAEKTEALVTLGIAPDQPDTGYGYIQYEDNTLDAGANAFRVKRFVEKPDLATAKKYLKSGDYLWNSGMFIWKVSSVLKEMETHLPENYALLTAIEQSIGEGDEEQTIEERFRQMRSISIDYGIMERAKTVYVIPSSFGWDDVGSWLAVGRINPADEMGNVFKGDVVAVESERCIVRGGTDRLIAIVGMEDTIVVDAGDALLICAKDSAGDIKKVLETLRKDNREGLL